MQGQAKILGHWNRFLILTKHGRRTVDAAIVSGHRVLVGLQEEIFTVSQDGKKREFVYPIGTGYMLNGEQGIYQIFPGGMYQMLRSRMHSTSGERYEAREMREMRQLAFDFVSRFRTWTLLGDEGQDFTDQSLRELADQLDAPKRTDRKLRASRRFREATDLRTPTGRRVPMPSAFTTSAGAYHLDKRHEDVQEILRWLDPERLRIYALVEGVHQRIDDAWRIFRPEACAQPGHIVKLALDTPTPQTLKVLRDQLRPVYRGLREIKVRPLNALALKAVHHIETMIRQFEGGKTSTDATRMEVEALRATLSQMRLVRALEMEVISPLSFLLARWQRLDASKHELSQQRVAEACVSFERSLPSRCDGLPDEQRKLVSETVRFAAQAARGASESPRRTLLNVKRMLKHLSECLT